MAERDGTDSEEPGGRQVRHRRRGSGPLTLGGGLAVLALLAPGCALLGPRKIERTPETWARMVAARGVEPGRVPDPFAATVEMVQAARKSAGSKPVENQLGTLQAMLFDRGTWAFEYDVSGTFTAEEAFAARRGNCVSYANLFIALGRSLGFHLRAALVARRPSSGREGDLVLNYNHVVAIRSGGPTATVYDFASAREGDVSRLQVLDDLSVAALAASNRGVELLRKGDRLQEARRELEMAARLGPELPAVHGNLGLVLYRLGDVDGALAAYRRGLGLSPREPTILLNLASLYREKGQAAESRQALAALDAGKASPHSLLVLGNLEQASGNLRNALRLYRDAARLAPAMVDPLLAIARAERARGHLGAARRALRKAARIDPSNDEVRAALAVP